MRFTPKTEQEIAQAGLLIPGAYDYEVADADETQSKAGNDMVAMKVRVYDGDGNARTVLDWLVDTDGSAYKIRNFAESAGMLAQYEKGELPASAMVGCTGRCKVIIKKDKTGEYPDKNAIADYLKPTNGTAPVARAPVPAELDDEIPF